MLVPTLIYICIQSPCKLRHLYRGTTFYMPSSKKRSPPSLSATPAQRILSLGHSSDCGRPTNSWDGQKSEKRVVQVRKSTRDARNFPTWTVTRTQLVPRHAYLSCHLWTTDNNSAKSLCSLHPYHTLQQPTVNFRRTNILSIIKSSHHFTVSEIFMFRVQHFLIATANKEKLITPSYTKRVFSFTYRIRLKFRSARHLRGFSSRSFPTFWLHIFWHEIKFPSCSCRQTESSRESRFELHSLHPVDTNFENKHYLQCRIRPQRTNSC